MAVTTFHRDGKEGVDGKLPLDNLGNAIQSEASSRTNDDTDPTPQESPIASVSTVKTLVKPAGAINLKVKPVGDAARIGNTSPLDGTPGDGFFLIADGDVEIWPCSDVANVFIKANSGTITNLYFAWGMAR